MDVTVILGHPPGPTFNHELADAVTQTLRELDHRVCYHDLYAERFDPVLPDRELSRGGQLDEVMQRYVDELTRSDGIVVIHPNWWGQPPAIVKGWIDRVFRPGVAYLFQERDAAGEGIPLGLLKARMAMIFTTANTPHHAEHAVWCDSLDTIWTSCVMGTCGVTHVERRSYAPIITSTAGQREAWLTDARATIRMHFPRGEARQAA